MALARLRQGRDQIEGAPQMADGLLVRRPLRRALARPLVVRARLPGQPLCLSARSNMDAVAIYALADPRETSAERLRCSR